MKLRITTLACFFLLCLSGSALASQLAISETQVQFGNMEEGPNAERTIKLTNTSDTKAVVTNVSTSCACTTTRLDKTELAPGEIATMVITYHTFKYPGKFDKTVHVFSGPAGKVEDVIHIVGYVDPIPMGVMEVTPRKTMVSGLVAGEASPAKIMVKNAGDAPMTVTAVKSRKFKTVYWQGEFKLEAGQSAPIEFKVTPKKAGRFMDIIMVHSDARNDIGKGYKAVLMGEAQ